MKRRKFIAIMAGVAAWPLGAYAQRSKVARIGALYIGIADAESFKSELRDGLRELGYVEGQTLHLSFALRKENWIDFLISRPSLCGSSSM
jgi:hypothetical protein